MADTSPDAHIPMAPVYTLRRQALVVGLAQGAVLALLIHLVFGLVVVLGFGSLEAFASDEARLHLVLAGSAIAMIGIGVWGWKRARQVDDENFAVQKAPPTAIHLMNTWDHVWVQGDVKVPRPVTAPHFGTPCAVCLYVRHEAVRGRWEERERRLLLARTWLELQGERVELDMQAAQFNGLLSNTSRTTSRNGRTRHTISWLPPDGVGSACGVVIENPSAARKEQKTNRMTQRLARSSIGSKSSTRLFAITDDDSNPRVFASGPGTGPKARPPVIEHIADADAAWDDSGDESTRSETMGDETMFDLRAIESGQRRLLMTSDADAPLMITPLLRHRWIDFVEAMEVAGSVRALVLLWLGLALVVWSLGALALGVTGMAGAVGVFASLAIGTLGLGPMLALARKDRFAAYRKRVVDAWTRVEMDLNRRRELLPLFVRTMEAHPRYAELTDRLETLDTRFENATRNAQAAGEDVGDSVLDAEVGYNELADELVALCQADPDLTASLERKVLFVELQRVQDRIGWSHHFYNAVVNESNSTIQRFPNFLLARPLGFETLPLWSDTGRLAPLRVGARPLVAAAALVLGVTTVGMAGTWTLERVLYKEPPPPPYTGPSDPWSEPEPRTDPVYAGQAWTTPGGWCTLYCPADWGPLTGGEWAMLQTPAPPPPDPDGGNGSAMVSEWTARVIVAPALCASGTLPEPGALDTGLLRFPAGTVFGLQATARGSESRFTLEDGTRGVSFSVDTRRHPASQITYPVPMRMWAGEARLNTRVVRLYAAWPADDQDEARATLMRQMLRTVSFPPLPPDQTLQAAVAGLRVSDPLNTGLGWTLSDTGNVTAGDGTVVGTWVATDGHVYVNKGESALVPLTARFVDGKVVDLIGPSARRVFVVAGNDGDPDGSDNQGE